MKNDKQEQPEQPESITSAELENVVGGVWPVVAGGIAAGVAIWAAGHDKGVKENSCG
jgi:lactobin A/cerein 7B family class IIb bacteriocin